MSLHWFKNLGCHTVHMHMLEWLEDLGSIKCIQVTIPINDSQLAYVVKVVYHSLYFSQNCPINRA